MRSIDLEGIEDKKVRDALIAIKSIIFNDLPILRGDWEYFVIEVDSSGTFTEEHNLGYTPVDFLITHDSADFSVNYDDCDDEKISFTVLSSGIIRGFYGKYEDKEI